MSADLSPNIHTLAELFTFLAQNPLELEAFKASPINYIKDHAIELPASDLAMFFSGPATHFVFLDDAHDKKAIEISPETSKILITPRDFDVTTVDETFSGNTTEKGDKLEMRFLDDSVVFVFTADYKFDENGVIVPQQDIDVYPFHQSQPVKGAVVGRLDKDGSFEITLDLK